jgi:hypothetical protein
MEVSQQIGAPGACARDHSKTLRPAAAALALALAASACASPTFESELRAADRLLRAGKQKKALERFEGALALADAERSAESRMVALLELAELCGRHPRWGRQGDAERWFTEAERLGRENLPARHPLRLELDRRLAHFHVGRGSLREARDSLERYVARVEWRAGAREAARLVEAGMLERVYEVQRDLEARDALRARRARLREGAPEREDAVATIPLAPARPNVLDLDGTPGFRHPPLEHGRLRVALGEPERGADDGRRADASRALVEDALRRLERALAAALPGFGFDLVGAEDDAALSIEWVGSRAHEQAAFGELLAGRGRVRLAALPLSKFDESGSLGELRAEALRAIARALGLPACVGCESLLAHDARRAAADRISERDAEELAALLAGPTGVRVDGRPLDSSQAPDPAGLLAELPLLPDGRGADLRVDLARPGDAPLVVVLDTAILRTALTRGFAHRLGIAASTLVQERQHRETRLGRALAFELTSPRGSGGASAVYDDHGLAGMDFLAASALELDFERDRARFLDPERAEPLGGTRLPLTLDRGLPCVEIEIGSGRTRALVDLAQEDALVLSEARALELGLPLLSRTPSPAHDDLDAPFESRLGVERLVLGQVTLRSVRARVARGPGPEPFASARIASGASLGLGALRRFARVRLDPVRGELTLLEGQTPAR